MRRLLVALILVAFAVPALAGPWVHLPMDDESGVRWVDVGSISEDRGQRTAWIRRDLGRAERDGTVQVMTQVVYDCPAREGAILTIVQYNRQGRSTYYGSAAERGGARWNVAIPDSVGEGQLNFVCSYPIGTDPRQIEGLEIER